MKRKLKAPPLPKKFCQKCGRLVTWSKPTCEDYDADTGKPLAITVNGYCSRWLSRLCDGHFNITLVYAPEGRRIPGTKETFDTRHWYRLYADDSYAEYADITAVEKLVADANNNGIKLEEEKC